MDFHELLQIEFNQRKEKNRRYSLRSFATKLNMDPSHLSKILNRKINVTSDVARKILPSLACDEIHKKRVLKNIEAGENTKKERYQKGKNEYLVLKNDDVWPFENKDEVAVLVALSVPEFKNDFERLREELNLSVKVFKKALVQLETYGFIKKNKDEYELVVRQVADKPDVQADQGKIRMQKEFLNMAIESLETIPNEQRLNGTLTLSFDRKLLPQAKTKIYNFLREFNAWSMAKSSGMNSVYNMTLALYPLSKEKTK